MSMETVVFLILFIGFDVVAASWGTHKSRRSYSRGEKHVSSIIGVLASHDTGDLVENRLQIKEDLKDSATNDYCYKLWNEFDESLVETSDGRYLKNTLDAEHFFNTATLGRGLINNQLLNAMPGMLTAIGVLGTFAGLAWGLLGLQIGSDDVQVLKAGISQMINGASFAFVTSIVGVALSLLFNFIQRRREFKLTKKISELQDVINHKFPRLTAEYSLHEISTNARYSSDALQGLAEKIGNKMQEAVNALSEEMVRQLENSLSNILAPAVNELSKTAKETATGQAEGAAQALSELIEKFLQEFGAMGSTQSAELERVNQQLVAVLERLSSSTDEMLGRIDEQIKGTLEEIGTNTQEAQLNARDQIEHVGGKFQTLSDQLQQLTERNFDGAQHLIEKTGSVSDKFESAQEGLLNLAAELEGLSATLIEATANFNSSSDNIRQAGNELTSGLHSAAAQSNEATSIYRNVQVQLENSIAGINQLADSLRESGRSVSEGSRFARETFNELNAHQEGYRNSLKNHVDEVSRALKDQSEDFSGYTSRQISFISSKVAELLKEYASLTNKDVHERMDEWNKQTREFCSSMTEVTGAMNELVGEFSDAVDRQRRVG